MQCPVDLDRHDEGEHELELSRSPKYPAGEPYCEVCNRYIHE